jgi:hypothetical protein
MRIIATGKPNLFVDVEGAVRELTPISLNRREELRLLLEQVYALLELAGSDESSEGITFEQLYEGDAEFAYYVDRALVVSSVQREWLSLDMLYCMVLPHTDSAGVVHANGLIAELNFGSLRTREKNDAGEDATYLDTLAYLWYAVDDLTQALELADNDAIPASELLELIALKQKLQQDSTEEGSARAKRAKMVAELTKEAASNYTERSAKDAS